MTRYPALILASVLTASSLQAQTTAEARESLQAGQYEDAAGAFRTILENDPSVSYTHLTLPTNREV